LEPLTDFDYVHFAIFCEGNVKKALERIELLQKFRKKHGLRVDTTYEEMHDLFEGFRTYNQGALAGFGMDQKGRAFQIGDYSKFCPYNIKTKQNWQEFAGSLFLAYHAMQCDFEAMRNGAVFFLDCSVLRWENFSLEVQRRGSSLYQDSYPISLKHIVVLNPPGVFRAIYNLIKPVMASRLKKVIMMESIPDYMEKYGDMYNPSELPERMNGTKSPDEARHTLYEQGRIRFENAATFKL